MSWYHSIDKLEVLDIKVKQNLGCMCVIVKFYAVYRDWVFDEQTIYLYTNDCSIFGIIDIASISHADKAEYLIDITEKKTRKFKSILKKYLDECIKKNIEMSKRDELLNKYSGR